MIPDCYALRALTIFKPFVIRSFFYKKWLLTHVLVSSKRAIRSHASTYCKGPNDSAVPPFLVPAKMLRQMTFYLCRNPLVYPLTQEIRCIYHTELQGRLGHAFVRNFHQCSSLCNGLSDLMIPFNAIFMEFHRFSLIYVISFRFYARTGFLSMGHKTVTTVYHS